MQQPAATVSVIIPFYQRESGILRRALDSIATQTYDDPIEVVVVDDASPVEARSEIAGLEMPRHIQVRVVRQPNGGPASARNRGLRERSRAAPLVAFLDSDDEWSPQHLARAAAAIAAGGTFYFADLFHLGQSISAFERRKRLDLNRHPRIEVLDDAYFFSGDMREQILSGNVIGTSTVVFDSQRHPKIAFREEYYSAGEDYLCWMDFAADGARFAFSTRPEAKYGRGVNIYSGASWGTDEHLIRLQNEIRYQKAAVRLHSVSPQIRRHVGERVRGLRSDFIASLAHRCRTTHSAPWRVLWNQFREDLATFVVGPVAFASSKLKRGG